MLQICEKCRNLIKTIPIPLSRNSNYLSNTSLPEAFEIFYAHNLSLRESLSPLHIKEHTNKSPILTDNNNNNFNHDDSMNKNVINANAKSRLSTNLQYNSFTLLNILKEDTQHIRELLDDLINQVSIPENLNKTEKLRKDFLFYHSIHRQSQIYKLCMYCCKCEDID
ncbi:uncharacterized protein LOC135922379 [Gordionus sp. m RMFG-2023]|uniref:uncharacterized protein LOC135922379 n=1 Tax=Gordionus sp. m RMFG-2023 TaxID=3053472 RepID=UPI0031FBE061